MKTSSPLQINRVWPCLLCLWSILSDPGEGKVFKSLWYKFHPLQKTCDCSQDLSKTWLNRTPLIGWGGIVHQYLHPNSTLDTNYIAFYNMWEKKKEITFNGNKFWIPGLQALKGFGWWTYYFASQHFNVLYERDGTICCKTWDISCQLWTRMCNIVSIQVAVLCEIPENWFCHGNVIISITIGRLLWFCLWPTIKINK